MSRKIITYFKNHLIRLNNTVLEINKSPFSNNKLCMDAQLEILDLIISLERKTRNLNSQKDNLSKMLHKKSDPLLTKNQSISIKMEISEIEKRTKEYFFVIRILRGIADGIVFTYFNKWDVKQFTFKEDVGFISGKKV